MDSTTADLIAIIAGVAALITAVGGLTMAIRAVRNKEQRAAKQDLQQVNDMLADERRQRIKAERQNYELTMELARHGIELPEPEQDGKKNESD